MGLAAVAERPAIGTRFDPLDAAYLDDPYPYLAEAREAAKRGYYSCHLIVTGYNWSNRASGLREACGRRP